MPAKYKADFMAKTKATKQQMDAIVYQAPKSKVEKPVEDVADNYDSKYTLLRKNF